MKKPTRPRARRFRYLDRLAPNGPSNQPQYAQAFVSYRDRPEPEIGDWVRVYRNLNNGQYSIVARSGEHKNKVAGHAPAVGLSHARLHLSEAGRRKAVEDRQRNVHAWAEGYYLGCADHPPLPFRNGLRVTYFPFIFNHFMLRTEPGTPVRYLTRCWAFESDLMVRHQRDIYPDYPVED